MDCCFIGTGYVGLVSGACLADLGHTVICTDNDPERIRTLSEGKIPIYEADLDSVVARNIRSGRLRFTTDVPGAISSSEFIFITVSTPSDENGGADLSNVFDVARVIASVLGDRYRVVINKSTVPVGSTMRVRQVIEESMEGFHEFDVVSNPEFLREGTAVHDFMNPARVVIGSDSQKATILMTELYRGINAPVLVTDPASAEMIKYASNAFLATKVAFINSIAGLCESVGADVREVTLGMGYDERIGFEFLKAGPGFGGSCFPKDCRALLSIARENGFDFKLLESVLAGNRDHQESMVDKVKNAVGDLEGASICALGIAFKANTDDIRESPAMHVVKRLIENGAAVTIYDPEASANAARELEGATFASSPYEACSGASVLLLLTEWDEFKWLDYGKIARSMERPIIIDTRNLLDPVVLRKIGFTYEGVGR